MPRLATAVAAPLAFGGAGRSVGQEGGMIRHIVLVRFRNDVAVEEVAAIFRDLDALRDSLPGMTAFSAGPNVSPEGLSRGYGHVFCCEFASVEARDAYLEHPAHQAAGARLVAASQGGVDGLMVVDYAL